MKRCKCAVSIGLLTVMLLTGCSRETAEMRQADESVTVTFWHYYNDAQKEGLDAIVAEYNETIGKEKNVTVEAVGLGSVDDITTKVASVLTDSASGVERPNMFLAYRDMLGEILTDSSDALLNYRDYFSEEELAGYYPDFLEEGEFGDALYIMPVAKSTELLFMNQTKMEDFFTENPKYSAEDFGTWESMARLAQAFYEWTDAKTPTVENDGKALIGLDNFSNYFIAQNRGLGAQIYELKEDGTANFTLDEAAIRKIFENYYIPLTKGYYGGNEKYCSDDLRQDKLYGYVGSVASVSYFPTTIYSEDGSETQIEMGIYPYPYFSEGEKAAIQQGAGIVALNGEPAENQAVAEFIKWISEEKGIVYASLLSYMPTSKANVENGSWELIEDENTRTAIEIGTQQVKSYHMARGFDFEGAYEARMDLEDYFKASIRSGREEYLGYLQSGMTAEEAANAMDYSAKSEAFYEGIVSLLDKN